MVLTAAITDRPLFEGRMLDMLRTETKLTSRIGAMPDTYSFSKQGFQNAQPEIDQIIFGSSEYIKDGLLPLTEWLGESPWSKRMLNILDDIWKNASVETEYGRIPSTSQEVNGEMLQTLSRVYWMTGERKYLDWAVRLGDYYLLDGPGIRPKTQRDSRSMTTAARLSPACASCTRHYTLPRRIKSGPTKSPSTRCRTGFSN